MRCANCGVNEVPDGAAVPVCHPCQEGQGRAVIAAGEYLTTFDAIRAWSGRRTLRGEAVRVFAGSFAVTFVLLGWWYQWGPWGAW